MSDLNPHPSAPRTPPLPQPAAGVVAYATPMSHQASVRAWREGAVLIVPTHASLPELCVKCNASVSGEPGAKRLTQKLAWHHPALFLLILPGLLVYAIVALIVQKKATVELSLCPAHAAKRRRWLVLTWVAVLLGLGMVFWGCGGGVTYAHHSDMWPAWLMIGGLVLAIAGGAIGLIGSRALTPRRIDDRFAWLKGAGPDFLSNFPAVQRP